MRRTTISFILLGLALFIAVAAAKESAKDDGKLFSFSKKNALDEWKEKIFKGKVVYTIDIQNEEGFVHGVSQQAASGYYYRTRFDPKQKPWISWKWKVTKFPGKKSTDLTAVQLDDYAARVYVVFPSGTFLNSKCIEYIWDEFAPEGTISPSPYSKNIMLYVLRSGRKSIDQWVSEERNILEDYKKAFGYDLKLSVGAVAFMTDSDSVQDTAEAFYDEIRIGYRR